MDAGAKFAAGKKVLSGYQKNWRALLCQRRGDDGASPSTLEGRTFIDALNFPAEEHPASSEEDSRGPIVNFRVAGIGSQSVVD